MIPPTALAEFLREDPASYTIDFVIDLIVTMCVSKGSGKWLWECVNVWRDLLKHMASRGILGRERITTADLNLFLQARAARARAGARPRADDPNRVLDPDVPLHRSRDGSSAAPGALDRLKTLRDTWKFDIPIDAAMLPASTGIPKLVETAPCPTLYFMKVLQSVAADKSKPLAVRNVSWGSCISSFSVLRGEQTNHLGLLGIMTRRGRRIAWGKTPKKTRKHGRIIAEAFILPLCGVLDDESWWSAGEDTLRHLPTPGHFAFCDFEAPPGRTNDPYAATKMRVNAMPQRKIDLSIQEILVREAGISRDDARKFTRHSFKHFLGNITRSCDDASTANLNNVELGRWAKSTLSSNPGLAPADLHAQAFLLDVSRTPRVYSANADQLRLMDLSVQQLLRAHDAITRAGPALPIWGGWDWLRA